MCVVAEHDERPRPPDCGPEIVPLVGADHAALVEDDDIVVVELEAILHTPVDELRDGHVRRPRAELVREVDGLLPRDSDRVDALAVRAPHLAGGGRDGSLAASRPTRHRGRPLIEHAVEHLELLDGEPRCLLRLVRLRRQRCLLRQRPEHLGLRGTGRVEMRLPGAGPLLVPAEDALLLLPHGAGRPPVIAGQLELAASLEIEDEMLDLGDVEETGASPQCGDPEIAAAERRVLLRQPVGPE